MLMIFNYLDAELSDKKDRGAKFKKFANLALPILALFTVFNIVTNPSFLGHYVILAIIALTVFGINYFNRADPIEMMSKKYSKDSSAISVEDYDQLAELVKNSTTLKTTIQEHCGDRKTFTIADAVWLWSESKKNSALLQTASQKAIFE